MVSLTGECLHCAKGCGILSKHTGVYWSGGSRIRVGLLDMICALPWTGIFSACEELRGQDNKGCPKPERKLLPEQDETLGVPSSESPCSAAESRALHSVQ